MKNSWKMVIDDPVDRNERSAESSSSVNLVSNFEKVTEAPNTSKEKVYDNMKSVEDSQFQLHEESNKESGSRKLNN